VTGPGRRLPLYLSPPHRCSYLADRQSQTLFVDPHGPMDTAIYHALLQRGFRRSGRIVYAPRCEGCRQCVSARIPVAHFSPRRIQRRIQRRNADLSRVLVEPALLAEHFALYQRYTAARHGEGGMADASPSDYLDFLCADWCDTVFMELRGPQGLLAVAVTDIVGDGLSSVYTFFDPDLDQRSLGTFAILSQIELARERALRYLYLGYWIRDCRKMAYKTAFRPIELWWQDRWQRFDRDESLPLT
jgi:arginine-tRNA-protein transferase